MEAAEKNNMRQICKYENPRTERGNANTTLSKTYGQQPQNRQETMEAWTECVKQFEVSKEKAIPRIPHISEEIWSQIQHG